MAKCEEIANIDLVKLSWRHSLSRVGRTRPVLLSIIFLLPREHFVHSKLFISVG